MFTKAPFLSGTIGFYLLFLLGNGIWAIAHLKNYDDANERNILRILPQFIGGTFHAYIFVKYGLLVCIIEHFAFDAVGFSLNKIRNTSRDDIAALILAGIYAVISYGTMTKPISDIQKWFNENPTFALEGWEFWDYAKLWVFLTSSLTVLFILLLYDRRKPKDDSGILTKIMLKIIDPALTVAIIYGAFSVLGKFFESVPYRIMTLAILLMFFKKDASGSAMAETFWSGLAGLYIAICIISALGFWDSVRFLFLMSILHYPFSLLTKENEY